MASLGADPRVEVRKTNIITLENIIMTHGQTFEPKIWKILFKQVLSSVLRVSIERYSKGTISRSNNKVIARPVVQDLMAPTPTFFGSKTSQGKSSKMNFDDDSVG